MFRLSNLIKSTLEDKKERLLNQFMLDEALKAIARAINRFINELRNIIEKIKITSQKLFNITNNVQIRHNNHRFRARRLCGRNPLCTTGNANSNH